MKIKEIGLCINNTVKSQLFVGHFFSVNFVDEKKSTKINAHENEFLHLKGT